MEGAVLLLAGGGQEGRNSGRAQVFEVFRTSGAPESPEPGSDMTSKSKKQVPAPVSLQPTAESAGKQGAVVGEGRRKEGTAWEGGGRSQRNNCLRSGEISRREILNPESSQLVSQ